MAESHPSTLQGIVVEEHVVFTFTALCRASGAHAAQLQAMVVEGLIEPTATTGHSGAGPEDWQFSGHALRRTRTALRLSSELELGLSGVALVMDLLDEIDSLRSRLRGR